MMVYHLDKMGADIYEDDSRSFDSVKNVIALGKNLDTPCFMTVMGSYEKFLMIYRDVRLVWAAKLENPAIYVNRCQFEGVNGLIVTMSD